MANDSYGLSDLPSEPSDNWEAFERAAKRQRRAVLGGRDVNAMPEIREALDGNARIGHKALNNLKRDEKWAAEYGGTSEAIQNARQIIGRGPGWIGRLEKSLQDGKILPALAAAILIPALQQGRTPRAEPQDDQL